jgi:hypothetical protein
MFFCETEKGKEKKGKKGKGKERKSMVMIIRVDWIGLVEVRLTGPN